MLLFTNPASFNLSSDEQKELYHNDDEYMLAKLRFRREEYQRQQTARKALGLGEDLKKEVKMHLLEWLMWNFEAIKNNYFYRESPMQCAYRCLVLNNRVQPTIDMALLNQWLLNVILHNRPFVQAWTHGYGFLGTTERGKKGSEMAETLLLLSDELLEKIFKGTDVGLLQIWNAAYPSRKCSTENEVVQARQVRLNEMMHADNTASNTASAQNSLEGDSSGTDVEEPIANTEHALKGLNVLITQLRSELPKSISTMWSQSPSQKKNMVIDLLTFIVDNLSLIESGTLRSIPMVLAYDMSGQDEDECIDIAIINCWLNELIPAQSAIETALLSFPGETFINIFKGTEIASRKPYIPVSFSAVEEGRCNTPKYLTL